MAQDGRSGRKSRYSGGLELGPDTYLLLRTAHSLWSERGRPLWAEV